jgi:hypothetical protein
MNNSLDFPAIGDIVWWRVMNDKEYGYVLTVEEVYNRLVANVVPFNCQEHDLKFSNFSMNNTWGKVE